MRRLLAVNLRRLFRSISFYLGAFVAFYFTSNDASSVQYNIKEGYIGLEESFYFFWNNEGLIFTILSALVVIGLFVGTDFSEGTYRNKICTGGRRLDIYLSNLMASFFIATVYFVIGVVTNMSVLWEYMSCSVTYKQAFPIACLTYYMSILAIVSVYVAIIHRLKTRTPNIMGAIFLMFYSTMIGLALHEKISQPKYLFDNGKRIANPEYLEEKWHKLFSVVMHLSPGSHQRIIAYYFDTEAKSVISFNMGALMACSVGIIIVASLIGAMVFNREDLK